ncbi:FAD-dependent oxidoreductase [Marmoricola sp. URHB0036]|uniref:FAD-dependent oxidoreductase n=1 Tax=Marmoricola sp. URHB0036 TaxID=1298863 RepID=UPI0003FA5292|nr:FAD-dependent oxidoreductase [Marmoricola sp. URHB0036]
MREQVVVVGAGMVGHRFVEELVSRDREHRFDVHLVGAEEYEPYNRILLTEVLARRSDVAALTLPRPPERVSVQRGVSATSVDRDQRLVELDDGTALQYDHLVLATGASAFVPPIEGLGGEESPHHVHVLRTIDDCRDLVARTVNARHAVVLGGGVLGLEAACGLARRGLAVTVVHLDAHLMADQLDPAVAGTLARSLDDLGVRVHTSTSVAEVVGAYGELVAVRLTDGTVISTDLMLVSCGIRPETGLAAAAGLPTGRGVTVGADLASPADPAVRAIGDCAETPEGCSGLVAPGWEQAARLARLMTAAPAPLLEEPLPEGIRLKAAGVDLVARGVRGSGAGPDDRVVALSDPQARRHVEVVLRRGRLLGFTALGAPEVSASLSVAFERRTPLPVDPAALLVPQAGAPDARSTMEASPTLIPADATICRCNGVTKSDLMGAWDDGCHSVEEMASATRATTGCGGCTESVCGLVDWLTSSDGVDENSAQPVRNTTGHTVAGAKHQARSDEMLPS